MVLACAAVGLWCTWRVDRGREIAVLIVASLVLIALSQAIFYVEGRHRLAVEPLVLVLAGIGLAEAAARVHLPRLESQRLRRARDNLT
jgi:protein-disulfide isomerase-like protein with CxxC motif